MSELAEAHSAGTGLLLYFGQRLFQLARIHSFTVLLERTTQAFRLELLQNLACSYIKKKTSPFVSEVWQGGHEP